MDSHDAPAPDPQVENRHSYRAPIRLRVDYERMNTFFADYTKNISKGGTFIRTARPLEVGTEFLFKLVVPRLKEPIAIRGKVRWIKRDGEPSPEGIPEDHEAGMGIRFIYDTPEQRQLVEATVEKLMIDSLGQLLYAKLIGQDRGR